MTVISISKGSQEGGGFAFLDGMIRCQKLFLILLLDVSPIWRRQDATDGRARLKQPVRHSTDENDKQTQNRLINDNKRTHGSRSLDYSYVVKYG
jgi:hypothetical protein